MFQAGESSQSTAVAVLDDAHDESEKTLTLTRSNASDSRGHGRRCDQTDPEPIQKLDPLMKRLLARIGRTAAAAHLPKKANPLRSDTPLDRRCT